MESSMYVTDLDIEWIHRWIGLDWVGWLWSRSSISNQCSTVNAVPYKLCFM